jgi:RNA polymerase sigma-70 factor (ECF subfamily)
MSVTNAPTSSPSAHEVFEILAREHADMLAAYLRSLVLRNQTVEDLFQETMLVAWRRLADYDRSLPFGPWLRGIATNLVLSHRRRAAAECLTCEPEVIAALEERYRRLEAAPADSFRERLDRLATCLERLPPLMRDAVDLVYRRGLSLKALAASVQASEEAVKKRVQRARQLLAECVAEGAP